MIIAGVPLFLISIILITTNYKSKVARWGSAAAFVSAMGAFSVVWGENFVPFLNQKFSLSSGMLDFLFFIEMLMNASSFFGLPYTLLCLALVYAEYIKGKATTWVPLVLFIPIIVNLIVYPTYKAFITNEQDLIAFHIFLCSWAIPYAATAFTIMIVSTLREKNIKLKKQREGMALLIVPFAAIGIFNSFITPIFGIKEAWRMNWFFCIQLFIFMFYTAKYGFMGVRFKVASARIDSTIKAVNSSTILLNHTLKNEIMKMDISMKNILREMDRPAKSISNIHDNINIVSNSVDHLVDMVDSVDRKISDFDIVEDYHSVQSILEESLGMVKQFLDRKKINVTLTTATDLYLLCDRVHMKEVLINLFKNAIEAQAVDGRITIESKFTRKEFLLFIKDDGKGIPKENLAHIMKPFFTTKRGPENFGLGLSYCYNMLKKHRGTLEVMSEENKGTTVILKFPANRTSYTPLNAALSS